MRERDFKRLRTAGLVSGTKLGRKTSFTDVAATGYFKNVKKFFMGVVEA